MDQNTIAIVWDFDKTLAAGYMQEPIFRKFNIDADAFWEEVNTLPQLYQAQGIKVNTDTIYLNHMITCASQGIFPSLNNEMLFDLGKELVFYPGIPGIFKTLRELIASDSKYQQFGIHVEHYIISTGLTSMIKGSAINAHVDGIWGCEFIETPIKSRLRGADEAALENSSIQQIGYIIDNTSKTRAIFEINKGSNKHEFINVNSRIENKDRRVPFSNMIYVADGPSDVPVFSVVKQYGGRTFAIYPSGDITAFRQVNQLIRDGRVDMFAEADYSEGTQAYMWLTEQTKEIADAIYQYLRTEAEKSASVPPRHISA